ncbi:MAG: response regulator [Gemmataceae bacterium]
MILPEKTTVLIVDDSEVDQRLAAALVDRNGWKATYADNGEGALASIAKSAPHIILTDLQMPGMGGLELVAEVREKHPEIPVVLMTAYGSEEIAMQALEAGAASYVPKRNLVQDLESNLERVLNAVHAADCQERLLSRLTDAELRFGLENDRSLVPLLVRHLRQYLALQKLGDATSQTRVCVALEEALLNAMLHGNLELCSDLRQDGDEPFFRLGDERRRQSPYADRQVFLNVSLSPSRTRFVIRDEGPGFDPSKLPDPTDPENMCRVGGRGLLLIRTFMDEVTFNDAGNEITLVKRREVSNEVPSLQAHSKLHASG